MNKRIIELDGIRGIAVIMVLLFHLVACMIAQNVGNVGEFVRTTCNLMWSGVDLFFVLSGFLIVGILLDVKGQSSYFKAFYIRRSCRILPLYLVTVLVFVLLVAFGLNQYHFLFNDPMPLLSYLSFTQNFFNAAQGWGPQWLAPTWSLAVEEQFYLMIPILVYWLNRKQLIIVFAIAVLSAPVFRSGFNPMAGYVLPFCRSDSILMGGLLAIFVRHPGGLEFVSRQFRTFATLFGALIAGTAFLTFTGNEKGDPFIHSWFGVTYTLLILLAVVQRENIFSRTLKNRVLIWFGRRSYAIYIFHFVIVGLVYNAFGYEHPGYDNMQSFIPIVLSVVIVLILAEVTYHLIEKPFLRFGHRYRYDGTTPEPTTESPAVVTSK